MIKVNLSSLAHAKVGQQEAASLRRGRLVIRDLDLQFLRGSLRFTRVSNGVLVKGELNTAVRTECTRCLSSFYAPVSITLEDTISLPGTPLTPEYPVRINEDGWIDLFPLIRDYIWVELPVNPVCASDCLGICPRCGGNRNLSECTCEHSSGIDPRWQALRALIENKEEA